MKRILVLGSSGSGKSTLAHYLGQVLGIEVVHLDSHFWGPNWVPTTEEFWEAQLMGLLAKDRWVMDGNYPDSLELRLNYADTVIFIDQGRLVCLWRCLRRFLTYRGDNRPELAPGCDEKIDWDFVKWIWNYPQNVKPKVLKMLESHSDEVEIILLDGDQAKKEFLDKFTTASNLSSL